ncbi:multicopper oxidase domain-containing protein [bacterium SCSIO 12741]|nr:multicopper oxidase domain-containing protein [bacterium SCSIO 12741]
MKNSYLSIRALLTIMFCFLLLGSFAQSQKYQNLIQAPTLIDGANGTIEIEARKHTTHKFNPADTSDHMLNGTSNQNGIETWCFNPKGDTTITYLGPTLVWHTGQMTNIHVTNKLPQSTTAHWHGAEVPAKWDGGPHQPIHTDSTWKPSFVDLDSAATMWYHPHIHDNTYPQVQFGMSGLIISKQASDPIGPTLPRTYGVDDYPLVLGDQGFIEDTSNNTWHVDTNKAKRPYGLVNGLAYPVVELPAHLVRLRILNGSTRKGFQVAFSDSFSSTQMSDMIDFTLIATDGGYVMKPDTFKTMLTGPGERIEVLLDLKGYQAGDSLWLRNMNMWMDTSIIGSTRQGSSDPTKFSLNLKIKIIADPPGYTPVDNFSTFTTDWDPGLKDTIGVSRWRKKDFVGQKKKYGGNGFTINGVTYKMDSINDTVCVGAKEIWEIHNKTTVSHPFHIHKIFFRVLSVDSMGTSIDLAERGLNGPKDDVLIHPNWKMRFLAKFDDYPNKITHHLAYMYHCHILTHEDKEGGGMMAQFVVTDQGHCAEPDNVPEVKPMRTMTLFPNPARNQFYLEGASKERSTLKIYDLNGRLITQKSLPAFSGAISIGTEQLNAGYYLIEWDTAEGLATEKLLMIEE